MKLDSTAESVDSTDPTGPVLALLTATAARQTIEHLQLLDRLGPGGRDRVTGPESVVRGRIRRMSEWGIALIAAGSAILGSIVTGFFAWKAGHRQAAAAESAGQAQAAALISTVQATLDEQHRARAVDRRLEVYKAFLTAADESRRPSAAGAQDGADPRLTEAFSALQLVAPTPVAEAAGRYFFAVLSSLNSRDPDERRTLTSEAKQHRGEFMAAARGTLGEL
ncbi:hypothetical protein [Streptomyces sp. NPDC047141]|uniref:hypothetical protein n=1 Tax=Streptomyces sp. NPDC047141 TaxID=3155738 RepID=UPI0033CFCF59